MLVVVQHSQLDGLVGSTTSWIDKVDDPFHKGDSVALVIRAGCEVRAVVREHQLQQLVPCSVSLVDDRVFRGGHPNS